MLSWFNRKRVRRERLLQSIGTPTQQSSTGLTDDHVSAWLQSHPRPDGQALGPGPDGDELLAMRTEAPYLHLTSSTVLTELRQYHAITGGTLSKDRRRPVGNGKRINPYDEQRDNVTRLTIFDADSSPFFVATDSIVETRGWFAEMDAASTEADFPIVLAMGSNYKMYHGNKGLTYISPWTIKSEHISTIFAPPEHVDKARSILGDGSKLNVRSWPRATRDARAVGRVEEGAGLALGL